MGKLDGTVVIGKCPKCQKPIGDNYPYSWCSECSQELPDSIVDLLPHVRRTGPTVELPKQNEPGVPLVVGPQPFRLLSFRGRINRAKFWGVFLGAMALIALVSVMVYSVVENAEPSTVALGILVLTVIAFAWISLANQVKRWHDLDFTGWMVLINLIPYLGGLVAIIWLGCVKGTGGPNSYGPDPLSKRPPVSDSLLALDKP